ncbi:MAG: Rieske (2Fe-2S) protein [Sulfobacillus benefaciens]|uniref:Rieske (2Fe-2S) protein n=1 Tax=Sulfobacillus benefaciens TaxID=453960 RepID=A0A2T2XDW1_9FIRM|nr:MAG: Rieske (2Fe-2S) protein [Sulfobacillus benefaciens]
MQMEQAQRREEDYIAVGASGDLKEEQMMVCVVKNQPVLIIRNHHNLYAISGVCSHAYSELIDGELEGDKIYCSLHFACFDIRTGMPLEGPANKPLRTFEVKEDEGKIWVRE